MTRVRLGLVATVFVAAALAATTLLPWSGTADAYDHLDYVVQVHDGNLPAAVGHEWKPEGHPGSERSPESRQFASAHPPLFYAIGALLAGPLLDSVDWQSGVLAMRLLNVAFGLAGLAGLAWIGWGIGGRHRHRWVVGLPLLGGLVFPYLRFSTEPYNDIPLTAASVLSIAICIHMLRFGPHWWSGFGLTTLAVLGMGFKSTFVLTLMGICLVLAVVMYRHVSGGWLRRAGIAALVSAMPVIASGLAWGWFYLRNLELSGYWYRSVPKTAVNNRSDKSLLDNLSNSEFYLVVPEGLIGRGSEVTAVINAGLSTGIFAALLLLTVIALLVARIKHGRLRDGWILLIGAALLLHLLGSYVLQLSHATGFGAFNARYFLPSIAATACLLVAGLLRGRYWWLALGGAAALLLAANLVSMIAYTTGRGDRELSITR
ncbi:MAG: hypothetical protein LH624_13880, partial [Cryobacterium sp.]|nr:hypothetical protein [Cryobacterium sp.]